MSVALQTANNNSHQSPYVKAKRGRLELKGGFDVVGNVVKGVFTWPKYRALYIQGAIETKYLGNGNTVGRLNHLAYSPETTSPVMRRLNVDRPGLIRSNPVRLEQIGMTGKIAGVIISGGAHVRRLRVDLGAIDEIRPENTTLKQMTAIYADAFSAGANIATAASYGIGLSICVFGNLSSRLAYWILSAQAAAVCWGESSTSIMGGIATFRAEDEHKRKTGEDNMSAVATVPCDITLGISTFYRNKFIYGQAREAHAAGNVARANSILAFYAADYEKKMNIGFGYKVVAKTFITRLAYAAEGVRTAVDVYKIAENWIGLSDPNDAIPDEVQIKNINSALMGIVAGVFTILSVPCFLNYTLAPYGFMCMAATTAIRILQSRYDHKDEKVAVKT